MILLGLLTVVLSGVSLVTGVYNPLYAPTDIPESPSIDSDLHFLGGMGLGLGIILLWIIPTIERQAVLFRAIWICAFLRGLGRFISIPVVGFPPIPILFFTLIEGIGVPFFIYWQNIVAKAYLHSKRQVSSVST